MTCYQHTLLSTHCQTTITTKLYTLLNASMTIHFFFKCAVSIRYENNWSVGHVFTLKDPGQHNYLPMTDIMHVKSPFTCFTKAHTESHLVQLIMTLHMRQNVKIANENALYVCFWSHDDKLLPLTSKKTLAKIIRFLWIYHFRLLWMWLQMNLDKTKK